MYKNNDIILIKTMEERGNIIQKTITDLIVLCNPKIEKRFYKDIISKFGDKLIFIPKIKNCISPDDYIPCLFYRRKTSHNFLIYFHGNSENIFQIEHYGLDFRSYLDMNIVLVEYPGYFLKMAQRFDSNSILSESLIVYDWIKTRFKLFDAQIFICGRSLGTSPAIFLSAHRNPKALFLISAFTSIKNIGTDKYLSLFVEEIFKSIEYIKDVKCSILFIHGLKDSLISYRHSEELYTKAKKYNNNFIDIQKIEEMTHNNFNLKKDIIDSILKFLDKIKKNENFDINEEIIENDDLYQMPLEIKKKIETYIFDIREFEIDENLEEKKASILMNISGERIAVVNDSKITIYNHRFLIDNEIDLSQIKNKKEIIKSIYETNDRYLICACEENDIFKIKIERQKYTIINIFSSGEENYKLGKFFENYIWLLSKNNIKIFDSSFSKEVLSINKDKTFNDFCLFHKKGLALMKKGIITLNRFENNLLVKEGEIPLQLNGTQNPLIGTYEYLIIGDLRRIIFFDLINNSKMEPIFFNEGQDIYEEIIFMSKIHNNLILGSTNYGKIIQITIRENGTKMVVSKFMKKMEISCILMIDYESLLISGDNEIDILSIPQKIEKKEKKEDKNCSIF